MRWTSQSITILSSSVRQKKLGLHILKKISRLWLGHTECASQSVHEVVWKWCTKLVHLITIWIMARATSCYINLCTLITPRIEHSRISMNAQRTNISKSKSWPKNWTRENSGSGTEWLLHIRRIAWCWVGEMYWRLPSPPSFSVYREPWLRV